MCSRMLRRTQATNGRSTRWLSVPPASTTPHHEHARACLLGSCRRLLFRCAGRHASQHEPQGRGDSRRPPPCCADARAWMRHVGERGGDSGDYRRTDGVAELVVQAVRVVRARQRQAASTAPRLVHTRMRMRAHRVHAHAHVRTCAACSGSTEDWPMARCAWAARRVRHAREHRERRAHLKLSGKPMSRAHSRFV